MPYARAEDLYEEIVTQIGDGHPDNAKEIALDALTSAFSDKSDDFIKPIVDVALNFELGGQFGGDRVQVLLDARTSRSLIEAIALLRKTNIKVVYEENGDKIRDRFTNRIPITDRLIFFFDGSSCFLAIHKHHLHNMIVVQVVKRFHP